MNFSRSEEDLDSDIPLEHVYIDVKIVQPYAAIEEEKVSIKSNGRSGLSNITERLSQPNKSS